MKSNQPSGKSVSVDLWQIAKDLETKQSEAKNIQQNLIFIGDNQSGQSSIINIIKGQNLQEVPPPTPALNYSYHRRQNVKRTDIMNLYEFGGGRLLSHMITTPITRENVKNTMFVIVLDLSKPGSTVEYLNYWFSEIDNQGEAFLVSKFEQHPEELTMYRYDLSTKFENHQDRNRVNFLPIQTLVIAHKYDVFEKYDVENRKWLSRTIRYLCHVRGASLIFSTTRNSTLSNQSRNAINAVVFGTSTLLQVDHMKLIMVSEGMDQMSAMGLPSNVTSNPKDALTKIIKDNFPEGKNEDTTKNIIQMIVKFPEGKIDSIRVEKDREMEKLLKELGLGGTGNSKENSPNKGGALATGVPDQQKISKNQYQNFMDENQEAQKLPSHTSGDRFDKAGFSNNPSSNYSNNNSNYLQANYNTNTNNNYSGLNNLGDSGLYGNQNYKTQIRTSATTATRPTQNTYGANNLSNLPPLN